MAGANDVSNNLDIIAQVPGDMLARESDGWARVPGGVQGRVLTANGPNDLPTWQPAAGAAGGGGLSQIPDDTASASLFAAKGWLFIPLLPLAVAKAFIDFTAIGNATYKAVLVRVAGTLIDAVLLTSDVFTAPSSGIQRELFDLNGSVVLDAGNKYAMLHVRTDATDTTTSNVRIGTPDAIPAPVALPLESARVEKKDPQAGDFVDIVVSPQVFTTNFLYTV